MLLFIYLLVYIVVILQVFLNFSHSSELPGGQISLMLRAAPGSLCSVRAIDESLLLLQPEKEFNIESVRLS